MTSTLYPPIEPYHTDYLKVSELHCLYFEESGNKNGNPILYLHGGPGGGTSSSDRRYFDPKIYRIIIFDQRGSGKSTPAAELKDNTTWDLVNDIEELRIYLSIEKWVIFGGSWGSTLALAYALKHSSSVKGLILRGIFTLRKREIDWFYQSGASFLFPEYWDAYLKPIPLDERDDLVNAYYKRLTGCNEEEKLVCAKAWSTWECATSKLFVDQEMIEKCDKDIWALAFARIECHYFVNKGFFESDSYLLDNIDEIKHLPCIIVQGRYDVVCPATTAWQLHLSWPKAEFHMISDAGHSAKEISITSKLVEAANKFRNL